MLSVGDFEWHIRFLLHVPTSFMGYPLKTLLYFHARAAPLWVVRGDPLGLVLSQINTVPICMGHTSNLKTSWLDELCGLSKHDNLLLTKIETNASQFE